MVGLQPAGPKSTRSLKCSDTLRCPETRLAQVRRSARLRSSCVRGAGRPGSPPVLHHGVVSVAHPLDGPPAMPKSWQRAGGIASASALPAWLPRHERHACVLP